MNMKTCKLLFQGDSITDADRVRENLLDLGTGYPYYAAQLLRAQHPDVDFTFWNRGIGCDETQHLLARIEPAICQSISMPPRASSPTSIPSWTAETA